MTRLLRELDRLDTGHPRPRSAARVRGDVGRKVTATVLALGLVVVIGGTFAHKQWGLTITADGLRLATPLGTPPEVAGSGSFAYMATQQTSERPVAYDPCDPVEYVVNEALAPDGADGLLVSAVEEISAATGLAFRAAGTTDEEPRKRPRALLPRRQPVLVAWTTPDVVPDLSGSVAGVAGSAARHDEYTGESRYVTGMVALDAPQLAEILARPQGAEQVRAIVVHELSHLVGLDHVDDPGELMYADNVGVTGFGPGDREGLAALGSGDCL